MMNVTPARLRRHWREGEARVTPTILPGRGQRLSPTIPTLSGTNLCAQRQKIADGNGGIVAAISCGRHHKIARANPDLVRSNSLWGAHKLVATILSLVAGNFCEGQQKIADAISKLVRSNLCDCPQKISATICNLAETILSWRAQKLTTTNRELSRTNFCRRLHKLVATISRIARGNLCRCAQRIARTKDEIASANLSRRGQKTTGANPRIVRGNLCGRGHKLSGGSYSARGRPGGAASRQSFGGRPIFGGLSRKCSTLARRTAHWRPNLMASMSPRWIAFRMVSTWQSTMCAASCTVIHSLIKNSVTRAAHNNFLDRQKLSAKLELKGLWKAHLDG